MLGTINSFVVNGYPINASEVQESVPDRLDSIGRGTMNDLRLFAEAGFTTGHINHRAIKYWQSLGATSNQYNLAKKQAEDLT